MKLPLSFTAHVFDDMHLQYPGLFGGSANAADEFPAPLDQRWHVFTGEHEPEKRQGGPQCWGPATTELMLGLHGAEFSQAVAQLLGFDVLIADACGGGMHLSGPGARLDTHTDFNVHPRTGWRRAANALLYLNHHWHPDWGGSLELDKGEVSLTPEMGRLVIFETNEHSWHGHPVPIQGEHWRKSLAVYFYDPFDSVPDAEEHDTLWLGEAGT